jgi:hypothetical protein
VCHKLKEMKTYFTLCLLLGLSLYVTAQNYTTKASGPYNDAATWVGETVPPSSGPCNCQITISSGHTVTITANVNITNARFILKGSPAASTLTFNNNRDLTVGGTNSSFDLQSNLATISKGNPANSMITLNGTIIYTSGTTRVPSTQPAGTVRGPASATSASTTWSNISLPVTLSDFKANEKNGKVNLSWTTTLEVNSSHFEIERSSNSGAWGKLASVSAAGNTGVAQNYSFTDNSPANGNNYYRLKIIDIDGQFEYSPIKNISIAVSGIVITTGPNPAYSTLNVMVAQKTANNFEVKLINRSGQVIYNRKYAKNQDKIAVDVSKFPEGNYFVEVIDISGTKTIKNILVLRK